MKLNWFVRKGILYWPVSIVGWVIVTGCILLAIYLFVDIDSRSHSVSDTLINWAFNVLLVGLAYTLVGFFSEKKD